MIAEQHYSDEVLIGMLSETNVSDQHLSACSSCTDKYRSLQGVADSLRDKSVWDDRELSEEPKPQTAARLRAFAASAKEEDGAAGPIVAMLLAAPGSSRHGLLAANPQWRTAGVVRKLIEAVDKTNFVDPKAAAEWAQLAVEIAESLEPGRYPADALAKVRATAWREWAYALFYVGSFAESLAALDRVEALLRECVVADYDRARAWLVRAMVCRESEKFEQAADLARRSKNIFQQYADRRRSAVAESVEGGVLVSLRRFSDALALYLRIAGDQSVGEDSRAWAMNNAAACYQGLSAFGDAEKFYVRGIAAFEAIGVMSGRVKARWGLGRVLMDQGRHQAALTILNQVRSELDELGMAYEVALASLDLAEVLLALDKLDEVPDLCKASVEHLRRGGLAYGTSALTALAYIREAADRRRLTPGAIRHVRAFIEKLPKQPELLFAYPA